MKAKKSAGGGKPASKKPHRAVGGVVGDVVGTKRDAIPDAIKKAVSRGDNITITKRSGS